MCCSPYRIILDEVDEIQHLFMVPGHTKNLLGGRFGIAKKRCRSLTAYSRKELLDALNELENDTYEWVTIQDMLGWKSVLQKFFQPSLPHISGYFSFHFSRDWPGKVKCKRRENDEGVLVDLLQPCYESVAHPSLFSQLPDVVETGVKERALPQLSQRGLSQRAYNMLQNKIKPLIPPQYREELCGADIPVCREETEERDVPSGGNISLLFDE